MQGGQKKRPVGSRTTGCRMDPNAPSWEPKTAAHEATPKPDGAVGSRVTRYRMDPNAPSWEPKTAAHEAAPKPDGAVGSREPGTNTESCRASFKYLQELQEEYRMAAPKEKPEALCKVARAAVCLLKRGNDRTKAARVVLGLLKIKARSLAIVRILAAVLRHGPPSKGILVARMIVHLADQACCRFRPERLMGPLRTLARKGGPEAAAAASMAVERLALAAVCSGAADLDWGSSDDSVAHSTDTCASQQGLWEASTDPQHRSDIIDALGGHKTLPWARVGRGLPC